MSSCSRVGLFGGTFDPIHNAHLDVARQALVQMELDKVILIPSKHPPHKTEEGMTSADIRYKMVQLSVEDRVGLDVSPVEINREGPSYTVDTLKEMKNLFDEIMFIVGADNLIKIDTWKNPEELLNMCPFVVAPRGGILKDDFQGSIFQGKDIRFLKMSEISLSSTEVRERIMDGQPVDGLVPEKVLNFIIDEGLYRTVPEEV
ncbi:nicotinate-nucleotide adenylyltransferase [Candidatus Bipolaricaulota bacterium]|nr:nicotinate-nucleotide adenylyltransferase [Candidatus Bipolaricaulota bacterium]MBS3813938.1 nicotinate-nucleotide adenylyltransferase [Candidatus Bipolaricaulota bacterium]MBS3825342.1 nicotinate-nucleotide adenylyltransferase [Candidatus Bipolaricaulota bacterium]